MKIVIVKSAKNKGRKKNTDENEDSIKREHLSLTNIRKYLEKNMVW